MLASGNFKTASHAMLSIAHVNDDERLQANPALLAIPVGALPWPATSLEVPDEPRSMPAITSWHA
jgi:hypothetical protein